MSGHYHVLCGLRGCYMPDGNNVHTTRKSAERDAAWCADDARQSGEVVKGSARSGYYTVGESNCIEITTCTEASCLEGDDHE